MTYQTPASQPIPAHMHTPIATPMRMPVMGRRSFMDATE